MPRNWPQDEASWRAPEGRGAGWAAAPASRLGSA